MGAATGELIAVDALGPAGGYRARDRLTITDVAGNALGELSLVPRLFVTRAMAALRRADTLPLDQRLAALADAGEAFNTGTVDGMSPGDYKHIVSRVTGMPISVVRSAAAAIADSAAEAYRSVQHARPAGDVNDWRDPLTRTGRGVWTRRGNVFGVHAPGNHPGVHSIWLEALALGYRVAVRPSRRDPFTPHRLISALRSAGFGDDQVVLLPTGYDVADEILRGADLAMAYGGEDVMRKYATVSTMLPQGPGRSKILLPAGTDWRDHLDMIVDSISHEGGRACVNATAVFVEGDPAPVAEAIAERLAAIPSLPPEDENAVLPVVPLAEAQKLEQYLLTQAAGTTPWLGGVGILDELGDGSAALRPAVHQLDRPDAPQAGIELPFPCVWVAPWTREAGIEPLKETLVLTAVGHDERLLDELLAEPTISNLYVGDHPTYWIAPGVPHDGYLADFLMRTKAVIRD
jgi:acyl-CoA reductase-like NAD-dependent aldehyde dehydrogenase